MCSVWGLLGILSALPSAILSCSLSNKSLNKSICAELNDYEWVGDSCGPLGSPALSFFCVDPMGSQLDFLEAEDGSAPICRLTSELP